MNNEIIYINKIARTPKCSLCAMGCTREYAITNLCTDKIGLDIEGISQNLFDINQSAQEIYNEYDAMEKIAKGGKFTIRKHMKQLRANKQQKALNKMVEYLEQKTLINQKDLNGPLQLMLIDADSQKYQNTNLVIAADCAPFVHKEFQKSFLQNQEDTALILFCPNNQNANESYIGKLAYMFENNNIKSVVVLQTETPCCCEMETIVKESLKRATKIIPRKNLTVSITGEIKQSD